jgi:hypothetical protein
VPPRHLHIVTPAKAGVQGLHMRPTEEWIPAFAGMMAC